MTERHARLSRRALLLGATTAAATAVLAACGGESATVAPTAAPATARPTTAAGGAAATTAPTTAAAANTPAAPAATTGAAATAAPMQNRGNIELLWVAPGGTTAEGDTYRELAKRFEAANANVRVKVDTENSDLMKQQTLIASGSPPDLLFFTINNWPAFASQNVLLPLDDFIARDSYDLDDFFPQIIKPYRFDGKNFGEGKLYGIPKEIAIRSLFYNTEHFAAAGITAPSLDNPWSRDQFLDAAKKLTKTMGDQTAQYGVVQETWWGPWMIWAWAEGGDCVNDPYKPTQATLTDPKVVSAIEFVGNLVAKERVAPTDAVTKDQGKSALFTGKRASMYWNGYWNNVTFRKAGVQYDVMPFPKGAGGRAQLLTGSIFGVSTGSKNPQQAWNLLKYVNSKEGQTLLAQVGTLLPSRKSLAQGDVFRSVTPPKSNSVYLDEIPYARLLPMHPRYPEMEAAVGREMDLVFAGRKTATEAAQAMNTQVNTFLKA